MAEFNWNDFEEEKTEENKSTDNRISSEFNWDAFQEDDGLQQNIETKDTSNIEPTTSRPEAMLRGAAQGLTFDFADELAGAASAQVGKEGLDKSIEELKQGNVTKAIATYGLEGAKKLYEDFTNVLSGKKGAAEALKSRAEDYKKTRDEERKEYEKAQEEYPYSYLGGEIAGSLAPAVMTGMASLPAKAGQKSLGKAAEYAAKKGLSESVKKKAKNLAKKRAAKEMLKNLPKTAAKSALLGAGYGGAYATGKSEESDPLALLYDTLQGAESGAKFGAGLGVLAPVIGAGVKGGSAWASEVPFVERAIKARQYASEGRSVLGEKNIDKIIKESEEFIQDTLMPFMQTEDRKASKAIGNILKKAENLGNTANVEKELTKIEKMVANVPAATEEGQKTLNELRTLLNSYKQRITKIKETYKVKQPLKPVKTGEEKAAEKVRQRQEKIIQERELKDLNLPETVKETILTKPQNIIQAGVDDAMNKINQMKEKIAQEGLITNTPVNFTPPKIENGVISVFETNTGRTISVPVQTGEFNKLVPKTVEKVIPPSEKAITPPNFTALEKGDDFVKTIDKTTGKTIVEPITTGEYSPVKFKKFVEKIEKEGYTETLTPTELQILKEQANEILQGSQRGVARKAAGETFGRSRRMLEQSLPKELRSPYGQQTKMLENIRLANDLLPQDILNKVSENSKIKLSEFIRKAAMDGMSGDTLRQRLRHFTDRLIKINPEEGQAIKNKIEDIASRYEIGDIARKGFGTSVVGTAEAGASKIGDLIGRLEYAGKGFTGAIKDVSSSALGLEKAVKGISTSPAKPISLTKGVLFDRIIKSASSPDTDKSTEDKRDSLKIFQSATDGELQEAADYISQTFGEKGTDLANKISSAVGKTGAARVAPLFSIMTSPAHAEMIKQVTKPESISSNSELAENNENRFDGYERYVQKPNSEENKKHLVSTAVNNANRLIASFNNNLTELEKSIIKSEGYVPNKYPDQLNKDTIGIGTLITEEDRNRGKVRGLSGQEYRIADGLTPEQAIDVLRLRLKEAKNKTNNVLTAASVNPKNLNTRQSDALLEASFQLGGEGLKKFPNTLKKIRNASISLDPIQRKARFKEAAIEAGKSDWLYQTPERAAKFQSNLMNGEYSKEFIDIAREMKQEYDRLKKEYPNLDLTQLRTQFLDRMFEQKVRARLP